MTKIKSLEEYRLLAARTLPDLGSMNNNLLHMEAGIAGEFLGEAVDILKKTFAYKKPLDKVHLGEELADVAIYLLGLSEILGINLEDEIQKKVCKNAKREYKVIDGVNTRIKE